MGPELRAVTCLDLNARAQGNAVCRSHLWGSRGADGEVGVQGPAWCQTPAYFGVATFKVAEVAQPLATFPKEMWSRSQRNGRGGEALPAVQRCSHCQKEPCPLGMWVSFLAEQCSLSTFCMWPSVAGRVHVQVTECNPLVTVLAGALTHPH